MFTKQLKFQRILSWALLIACILVFVYSLGFLTDAYRCLYHAYDPDLYLPDFGLYGEKTLSDGTPVKGGKLYMDMQEFNNQMLICAIVAFLVSLSNFVMGGQKRRNYYIGNYVSVGLICATNLAVSIFCMINIASYLQEYKAIDFVVLKQFCEENNYYFTDSTFWFDIGFVVFGLLLAVSALLVFNVLWKVKLMKNEKALLGGREVAA